ncbi:hypothetical protein [Nocardiopsis flavescens]
MFGRKNPKEKSDREESLKVPLLKLAINAVGLVISAVKFLLWWIRSGFLN